MTDLNLCSARGVASAPAAALPRLPNMPRKRRAEHDAAVVESVTARVGRLETIGSRTRVGVGWATNHRGRFPTPTTIHTSLGATAIRRWLRPAPVKGAHHRLPRRDFSPKELATIPYRNADRLLTPLGPPMKEN